jgi:pilus assembly protein CpaF
MPLIQRPKLNRDGDQTPPEPTPLREDASDEQTKLAATPTPTPTPVETPAPAQDGGSEPEVSEPTPLTRAPIQERQAIETPDADETAEHADTDNPAEENERSQPRRMTPRTSSRPLMSPSADAARATGEASASDPAAISKPGAPPTTAELRRDLHRKLIQEIDQAALSSMPDSEARSFVEEAAAELVNREVSAGLGGFRERLLEQLVDDILGLGPLEPLLRDPSIAEIMVNGPGSVYIERAGRLTLTGVQFRDDAHVLHVIERILAPAGRTIDESTPMVDARLPDGSRVNAVIPPASTIGPLLTIRKFVADRLTAEDLIEMGSLTQQSADLLQAAVDAGLNVIVSGGTGSGKTTMLNVLSTWIPSQHRILTIEDPAELSLRQPHVVALEARPGAQINPLTQAELLKNSLRMRPDRIIVGEVRGGEAFDMLQAMNTGHEGSMSTVHANTPRDAVRRIENMVLMAGFELPIRAIREQIASALDMIVQVSRLRDGSRRVVAISEVAGMEDQTVTMQDLFAYDYHENELVFQGLRPACADRLEAQGFEVPIGDGYESTGTDW